MKTTPDYIIFFDSVCNLCNASVNFIIKKDKKNIFKFSPLQSAFATQLLSRHPKIYNKTDSIILFSNGKIYTRSTAALHIAKKLCCGYKLLYILIIIPTFIRNFVYDFIAKNRYKWFGKKETCSTPSPDLKSKFIE